MKNLLFLLLLIPALCTGQTVATRIYNADSSQKAQSNAASPSNPITVVPQERDMRDTDYQIMLSMLGMITSSGGLCSVLATDNYCGIGTPIILGNGTDSTVHNAYDYEIWTSAGTELAFLGAGGGGGALQMKDQTSPHNAVLHSSGLTGNRNFLFPDEPTANGAGLPSQLVTHSTKYPITFLGSGSASAVFGYGSLPDYYLSDGVGNTLTVTPTSWQMTDGGSLALITKTGFQGISGSNEAIYRTDSTLIYDGTNVTEIFPDSIFTDNGSVRFAVNMLLKQVGLFPPGGGGNPIASLFASGSNGLLLLQGGAFIDEVNAASITNNRNHALPDHSGTILTDDGGSSTQSLVSASTMTVTHGLSYTPTRIQLTAITAIAAASQPYISAISSTTFTITFPAPVTGSCGFYWQAY
jgi:hypothetical protein